jgi:hypothetical protein
MTELHFIYKKKKTEEVVPICIRI